MIPRRRVRARSTPDQSPERTQPPEVTQPAKHGFRIAGLIITLVLLTLVFCAFAVPAQLANQFAERSLQRRDLSQATAWLEFSDWFSNQNPDRHLIAARIARHRGDVRSMQQCLANARIDGATRAAIEREEVLARAQSGKLDGIESHLNRWLADGDVDSEEIIDAYANGLAINSRFGAALRLLDAWHRDHPENPVPLYRKGRIEESLQQLSEAKSNYEAAIVEDPKYFPALYSMGRLLLAENRNEAAMDYFERCLSMPDPAVASLGVAQCLKMLGKSEQAAELLRLLVELDAESFRRSYQQVNESPQRFVAATELGKLRVDAGDYQEAERWLEMAIEANPRDVAARYAHATALRGLGKIEQAEAEFKYVREVKEALGQVTALRNRINRSPEDFEARLELGKILMQNESAENGLFWIRSVLTLDPDNEEAKRVLAAHDAGSPQALP